MIIDALKQLDPDGEGVSVEEITKFIKNKKLYKFDRKPGTEFFAVKNAIQKNITQNQLYSKFESLGNVFKLRDLDELAPNEDVATEDQERLWNSVKNCLDEIIKYIDLSQDLGKSIQDLAHQILQFGLEENQMDITKTKKQDQRKHHRRSIVLLGLTGTLLDFSSFIYFIFTV